MDYLCAKFGDCTFSRFGVILRTETQTDRQTELHSQTQMIASRDYYRRREYYGFSVIC